MQSVRTHGLVPSSDISSFIMSHSDLLVTHRSSWLPSIPADKNQIFDSEEITVFDSDISTSTAPSVWCRQGDEMCNLQP